MHIDPVLKDELKKYLLDRMNDTRKNVIVVSAYPLAEHEMKSVIHQFSELGNVKAENVVDAGIYAGFIIKFGTKRIDLSLKRKLEEINHSLNQTLE